MAIVQKQQMTRLVTRGQALDTGVLLCQDEPDRKVNAESITLSCKGLTVKASSKMKKIINGFYKPSWTRSKSKLVDLDFALKLFGKDQSRAVKEFVKFHNQIKEDNCMDIDDLYRITDQEAGEIIKSRFNLKSSQELY